MNAAPIKSSVMDALTALARSPNVLKQIEDQHAKLCAERTARVARINNLDEKASRDWPASQAAIRKAIEAREKAIRDLRVADEMLNAAKGESFTQSDAYTRFRREEELALIADADLPLIAAWKDELLNELTALRRPGVLVTGVVAERNPVTRKQVGRGYSNHSSIVARIEAVLKSYREADDLKLLPDMRKVPAILAEIRASWPVVDNSPGAAQPT